MDDRENRITEQGNAGERFFGLRTQPQLLASDPAAAAMLRQ
jgi:hypothetical protein